MAENYRLRFSSFFFASITFYLSLSFASQTSTVSATSGGRAFQPKVGHLEAAAELREEAYSLQEILQRKTDQLQVGSIKAKPGVSRNTISLDQTPKHQNTSKVPTRQQSINSKKRQTKQKVQTPGQGEDKSSDSEVGNSESSDQSFRRRSLVVVPPGPTCTGTCCSNRAPKLPAGTPTMPSRWWSAQMAHGAQIHIRANTWSTWWTPPDGKNFVTSAIMATSQNAPPMTTFFTVIRKSATQIVLQTPAKTCVRAGGPLPAVTGSATFGAMDFTANCADVRCVLTVEPVSAWQVHFRASDGLYLSSNEGPVLRWSTTAQEWERWDIREVMRVPAIRGANIGAWLVYEQWMDPNFYANPPTWKDGTAVRIQNVVTGWYVTALNGGGSLVTCNVTGNPGVSETFNIRRQDFTQGYFQFGSSSALLWSMVNGNGLRILADQLVPTVRGLENFLMTFSKLDPTVVLILAPNKKYLRAQRNGVLTADVALASINPANPATWGFSAFRISVVSLMNGEWQVTQQLGNQATTTMLNRGRTFLVEADWAYMRSEKINAVRIPVGYWLTQAGGEPPFPTEDVALLDWAFAMGAKYGVRIWLSLHAAPGSQNGWDHSATRDGFALWATNPSNVKTSVEAVRWFAQRYASKSAFLGIGLLNEPLYDEMMSYDTLINFYEQAYQAVRQYSRCAYVAIMNRIGSSPWEVMDIMRDQSHTNTILEVHSYNVYNSDIPSNITPEKEMAYMQTSMVNNLASLQSRTSAGETRPLLIGEFSNAMASGNVGQAAQVNLARTQLQVYAKAQAGWFFWSLKHNRIGYESWSWKMSSKKGWLPRKPGGGWW